MLQKYLLRQLFTSGTFQKKQIFCVTAPLGQPPIRRHPKPESSKPAQQSICIFQHSHSLKFGSPCMNRPLLGVKTIAELEFNLHGWRDIEGQEDQHSAKSAPHLGRSRPAL